MTATSTSQIDQALAETNALQRQASDPSASVWVSANAGTGKTHVLTNRVMRLLLSGTKPERILCVTYTKAAAAEMSKRIFDQLATWVMASEEELKEKLHKLKGAKATGSECDYARTLFTSAIETPGGLKVQTIHAFCERLLQRFPLEAGIAPGFRILDETEAKDLKRTAIDRALVRATANPESLLGQALSDAIAYAADDRFDDILGQALDQRQWLKDMHAIASTDVNTVRSMLHTHFSVSETDTVEQLTQRMADVLTDTQLETARDAFATGSVNDNKFGKFAELARKSMSHEMRCTHLESLFYDSKQKPRPKLMTAKISNDHQDTLNLLVAAQTKFCDLFETRLARTVIDATTALYIIADAVIQNYTSAKKHQSALDFADLISSTANLLTKRSDTEWVLYKLDEGIAHILVDESQDTSPDQWRLISALSEEFFTGLGASDETRTIFAVGDEKQSIYSFQGAAPKEFAKQGDKFEGLAHASGQPWHQVPLKLSFRTTSPVLNAVDEVFSDAARTPGLSSTHANVEHLVKRVGQAGVFEVWPTEKSEKVDDTDPWSPLGEPSRGDPVANLADRIADTIAHWRTSGETLESTGQPIEPGHILILVRKRQPFTPAMVSALKARDIPVSGADRINLLNQIAVQDMLSLADFLTLPEDDLALAEVLKSPIFGFDDDDLIALAPKRKLKTLWKMLLDNAPNNPRFTEAAETLKRWRKQADFAPPYEFFARLFDRDHVRDKLLARLGPDAGDALDEFIDLALNFDEQEPPSLSGFLSWIRADSHEVKRDLEMGRNEVRVMTVHGAKGLEAPIVFLPDTCAKPASQKSTPVLTVPQMERPQNSAAPFVWAIKGATRLPAIRSVKSAGDVAELEESNRLLYVAMTRARDRLYIAGFERPRDKIADGSWYAHVQAALSEHLNPAEDHAGRPVQRLTCPQTGALEDPKVIVRSDSDSTPLPIWAKTAAPSEPQLAIPLAPSRLAPYEIDDEGEPLAEQPQPTKASTPSPRGPIALDDGNRFLRGNLTHALLQHLPQFEPAQRAQIAEDFVAHRGAVLTTSTRANIVAETRAILDDPQFAPLFGAKSRAEVPIVAHLKRPSGTGPDLRLNGAIDRLADLGDSIFVVDFKTNRAPPATLEEVADAYLYQLASYRLALRQIYGTRPVRAALLWTDGPTIMEIPATKLDLYQDQLWQLQSPHLDET